MRTRNSEKPHFFQQQLYRQLKAYSLQGLLMNKKHEFTAAVEAVEYEEGDPKYTLPFTSEEIHAKYVLAHEIGVPLYILRFIDGKYRILEIKEEDGGNFIYEKHAVLNEEGFITWWGKHKQTKQNKHLNNGGEVRIRDTIFDAVLRKNGYVWGGNIDGFVLTEDNKKVKYIIDNISVSKPNLADEPSHYFNSSNPKHGPRYEGWYAAVKLANQLNVPHVLFTIDRNDEAKEHVGFTFIDKLTPEGIYYFEDIDYSGPLAHPGRSLAQLDRASAHSTRSAVQPMLAADQHTC